MHIIQLPQTHAHIKNSCIICGQWMVNGKATYCKPQMSDDQASTGLCVVCREWPRIVGNVSPLVDGQTARKSQDLGSYVGILTSM